MQEFSEKAFTELNDYLQLLMKQQAPSGVTGTHPLAALLTIARRSRSIVSLYRTEQDEDGEIETRSKTAIRYVKSLPEVRMLRFAVVTFESETLGK